MAEGDQTANKWYENAHKQGSAFAILNLEKMLDYSKGKASKLRMAANVLSTVVQGVSDFVSYTSSSKHGWFEANIIEEIQIEMKGTRLYSWPAGGKLGSQVAPRSATFRKGEKPPEKFLL